MSSLVAKVSKIQNRDSLHIVEFEYSTYVLSMMSLDLDKSIQVGSRVRLVVKPTHIIIARGFNTDISCSNRLNAVVESCENGELLSSVKLKCFDTILESIITLDSSKKMNLKVGDSVEALIQASELSIGEVLND